MHDASVLLNNGDGRFSIGAARVVALLPSDSKLERH